MTKMKRVISFLLTLVLCAGMLPAMTVEAQAKDAVYTVMNNNYNMALKLAKREKKGNFKGLCGFCTASQLQAFGVTKKCNSGHGKSIYPKYEALAAEGKKTSGGFYIKLYSRSEYKTIAKAMEAVEADGYLDGVNQAIGVVGFSKGSGSTKGGQKYGHALAIYKVADGKVYYTENESKGRENSIKEFTRNSGKNLATSRNYGERVTSKKLTLYKFQGIAVMYKCEHTFSKSGICTKCQVADATQCTMAKYDVKDCYWVNTAQGLVQTQGQRVSIPAYVTPYVAADNTAEAIAVSSVYFIHVADGLKNIAKEDWALVDYYFTRDGQKHALNKYIPLLYRMVFTEQAETPPIISCIKASVKAPTEGQTLTKGKGLNIAGTITSSAGFQSITAVITDSTGKSQSKTATPKQSATSFALKGSTLDKNLKFGKLAAGDCTLTITVVDGNGEQMVKTVNFKEKDSTKPTCKLAYAEKGFAGGKTVTLTATPATATIKGTVGDTAFSAKGKYTVDLTEDDVLLTASAACSGYNPSAEMERTVSIPTVQDPTVSTETVGSGVFVTLKCATENASIYYSLNGGKATPYTGAFAVMQNAELYCYAQCNGYADSEAVTDTVTVDTSEAPAVTLEKDKVALGDSVKVSWKPLTFAETYLVRLWNEDGTRLLDSAEVPGTVASFIPGETGSFRITVTPRGQWCGEGTESEAAGVEIMAPCTVRYLDHDGTEYFSQTVRYGYGAQELQTVPTRRGHQFLAWRGDDLTCVTRDSEVQAAYQKLEYTVRFYDYDGSVTSQRVAFGESAVEPPHPVAGTGYVFGGWAVSYVRDNASACDWTNVDSDMDLVAVKALADPTLPVQLSDLSADRDGDRNLYTVSLSAKALTEEAQTMYLRVVLLNADGQMVKTGYQEVQVDGGQTARRTITLNYNDSQGKAVSARAYALGIRGSDQTGSALAAEISAEVTDTSTSQWSAWSEWVIRPMLAVDGYQVETMTQYRYAKKQEMTSLQPVTGGDWIDAGTTVRVGEWSEWSAEPVEESENVKVETKLDGVTYKTQYRYYRYYGKLNAAGAAKTGKKEGTAWSYFCINHAKKYLTSYTTKYTPWKDTKLTRNTDWGTQSCSCHGKHTAYKYDGVNYYADSKGPLTRQVVDDPGTTLYRCQQTEILHCYWKWGEWSDWSATKVSANDSTKVESTTFYRYRTRVDEVQDVYTPAETQTVCGTLPEGVGDFSGKLATVMVYNVKNTDPNESQIQYVGQTVIQANNAYDFSFIPKADPTADSGDYIVALGIQGANKLVNVDVIEAPKPDYAVTFVDGVTGDVVETQQVKEGGAAQLPQAPEHEGYTFTLWDKSVSGITADTTVSALYVPQTYAVVWVDWLNRTVSLQKYQHGQTLKLPAAPQAEGHTFAGWENNGVPVSGETAVTGDMILYAAYTPDRFTVTFTDAEGETLEQQQVTYGQAAVLPDFEAAPGQVFLGWSSDTVWWNVTEDLTVSPLVVYEQTTEMPYSVDGMELSADGQGIELECTEDAVIYYTIDGSTPSMETLMVEDDENVEAPVLLAAPGEETDEEEEDAGGEASVTYRYDGPIFLTEEATVRAVAVAEGKNTSEELEFMVFAPEEDEEGAEDEDLTDLVTYYAPAREGDRLAVHLTPRNTDGINGFAFRVLCDRSAFVMEYTENGYDMTLPEGCADALVTEDDDGYTVLFVGEEKRSAADMDITIYLTAVADVAVERSAVTVQGDLYGVDEEDFSMDASYVSGELTGTRLLGDLDRNGEFSMVDVLRIAKHVMGSVPLSQEEQAMADVTGDGVVSNADVIRLARYIVGMVELR